MSSDPVASGLAAQPRRWQFGIPVIIAVTVVVALLTRGMVLLDDVMQQAPWWFLFACAVPLLLLIVQAVWSLCYLFRPPSSGFGDAFRTVWYGSFIMPGILAFMVFLASLASLADPHPVVIVFGITVLLGIILTIGIAFFFLLAIGGIVLMGIRSRTARETAFFLLVFTNLLIPFSLFGLIMAMR